VYSEWVDAAGKDDLCMVFSTFHLTIPDAVAHEAESHAEPSSGGRISSGRSGMSRKADEYEEDDRRYEGEGIVADDEYD
jgi:hypothetical protein